VGLEHEIKDLDRQIRDTKRVSKLAPTLEEKLVVQRRLHLLETQRNQKRRTLFEAQDEIDQQRDALIEAIAGRLKATVSAHELFVARYSVVRTAA
jgi:adenine-specific DNA-methyltransferase